MIDFCPVFEKQLRSWTLCGGYKFAGIRQTTGFSTWQSTGWADLIVTGDADLLVLHPFEGIEIVTPAVYLARVGG